MEDWEEKKRSGWRDVLFFLTDFEVIRWSNRSKLCVVFETVVLLVCVSFVEYRLAAERRGHKLVSVQTFPFAAHRDWFISLFAVRGEVGGERGWLKTWT